MAQRKSGRNRGKSPQANNKDVDQFDVRKNINKLTGGTVTYGSISYSESPATPDTFYSKEAAVLGNKNRQSAVETPLMLDISNNMHNTFNSLKDKMQLDIDTVKGDYNRKIENLAKELRDQSNSFVPKETFDGQVKVVYGAAALLTILGLAFVGFVYDNLANDVTKNQDDVKEINRNINDLEKRVDQLNFEQKLHQQASDRKSEAEEVKQITKGR